MLICPQCQFENPEDNKFCQECGSSLTEQLCPDCGSKVPFQAQQCPNCGAETGVYWWAIVSGGTLPALKATDNAPAYLDGQKRYKLLPALPSSGRSTGELQVKVLDCQPLQLSPLQSLLQTAPAEQSLGQTLQAANLPAVAQPYLVLQAQVLHVIPELHDAWQQNGQDVLLLENRSHHVPLVELWCDEEVLPLQVLHWLHEMSELWEPLAEWNCRQSLLEVTNLLVDEDQVFCLKRLYAETRPLSLADLGAFWQEMFTQTQRTQLGPLALMLHQLQSGSIQSVEQLQARLRAIANDLQSRSPALDATIPSPELPDAEVTAGDDGSEAPTDRTGLAALEDDVTQQPPDAALLTNVITRFESDDDDDDDSEELDDSPTVVLPMQLFSLDDAGRTDTGRQRDHNEDSFGIQTEVYKVDSPSGRTLIARGLYILCDGMGGHAGGEVASALAVDTLKQYFKDHWLTPAGAGQALSALDARRSTLQLPSEASIIEAIHLTNQAIYDENQKNARSGSGRMGTTLVLLLVQNTHVAVAHVGDSRLYCLSRRRGLEQVTSDHDVGQREIQRGVEPAIAYARPDAYQLTQALGPRDNDFVKPDVHFMDLNEDTVLLLCSDGLTDNDLLETHWRTHLEPLLSSQANLERGVGQLIDLANQYNGHDNITAVAIRIKVRPNMEQLKLR